MTSRRRVNSDVRRSHQVKRSIEFLIGSISGALSGSLVGAAIFALYIFLFHFTDESAGVIRMTKGQVLYIGAVSGALYGVIPGSIIGTLVGAFSLTKFRAIVVGIAAMIVFEVVFMFAMLDEQFLVTAAIAIPGGALVGLLVHTCCGRLGTRV